MTLQERIQAAPRQTFIFFGILLFGFYYMTSTDPHKRYDLQIKQAKSDIEVAEKKLKETKERFENKAKFQAGVEQLSLDFRKALEYLPKEADVQDLVRKISKEARASDVELADYKPSEIMAKDFYDELPMDISFKGSYTQLMSFLDRVTKIPRIINIQKVELSNPVFEGNTPRMEMKGTLVGYRYKEGK